MSHWTQEGYIKALRFAAEAHQGQTVPGTELPYVLHIGLVSMEVIAALQKERVNDQELAVQCALLHDVVEDTATTADHLRIEFGHSVASGVLALTKDKALARDQQLADSLRRIRQQPPEVWMVKLADRISNLQRPPAHWSRERAFGYREEAVQIHRSLKDASSVLAGRLREKIDSYGRFME